MGPTLFVDVIYNSGVVCSNQNMMALLYYSPVIEGQFTALSSSTMMWSSRLERVHTPAIRKSPMWAPQPWVEASVKMVNSIWKGQIGIPDVRNDRFCHCLSRVARTTWSERLGVEKRFLDLMNESVVRALSVDDPVG